MDNQNIAAILKDAINASTTKIQSESKRTKVFVLPPELLKGLLVKNEIPKITENTTNEAETSSSKNNKKSTTNKKQSLENSKSTAPPVDLRRRSNNGKSTANKDLKNSKLQKSSNSNPRGSKIIEQNHEQSTVLENNETSDTLKSVEKPTIPKKSNRDRKAKTKIENETCTIETREDPHTILDKNQGSCTEINHELNNCSINVSSDKPLDNCSKEKCTVEIADKVGEKSTETNHKLQVDSNSIIHEDTLTNPETVVLSCEKKLCDETAKVDDIKTEGIDQVLQNPHIELSQSNASQTILNVEMSSHVELNDENEVNVLSFKQIQLSNNEETTIVEEETYIVEEIIEIIESDKKEVSEETDKVDKCNENNIETDRVLPVENTDLPKSICAPINIKSKPISKTNLGDFRPIVEQKRSSTARVYVNKRKSRKQISNNEGQERSIPPIHDNCNKDSLINPSLKEISLENSCEESQSLQKVHEESTPEIDYNYDENDLTTIPKVEIEEKCISKVNCAFDQNNFIDSVLTEAPVEDFCEQSQNVQKDHEKSELKIDHDYDENNLTTISKIEVEEKFIPEENGDFSQDNYIDSLEISESNSEKESKSDDNCLTYIARTEITTTNQCQEITYFEVQEQSISKIDTPLTETVHSREELTLSQQVKEENSLEIESSFDHKSSSDLASTENPYQIVNFSNNSEEQINMEIKRKIDHVNLDNTKTETSKVNSNEEIKQEKIVSVLENNITYDLGKTGTENKLFVPSEKSVGSSQDPKGNTEEIQSIESIQKTNDIPTTLKNQSEPAEAKSSNTRNRRTSSSTKKHAASSTKAIKSPGKQIETDIESIENTPFDGLAKFSAGSNVSIGKSKTSISCNNNDHGNNKDYWENEQNCSIRSLRQLRNRTKVIPQDPEHLNKLKNHIEKESLQLRNSGKSDIIVRYDFDCSNKTRSVSLSLEPNSAEKLSKAAKKISRKPKSTDNYLEKTSRMIALRRCSAILQNEIKLPPILEDSNRVQSKESLNSETVDREKNEIDNNQTKILKPIVYASTNNFESTIIQKDDQLIISDSNLNGTNLSEKSSCNIGDSLDFNLSTETAIDTNNSSLKREKIIVVRKIKKGRRSKASQSKDDPAEPTDIKKNDNKGNEIVDDSKMVDNTVSCVNEAQNNFVQDEISKTANNTNPLEDSGNAKSNFTSINSSNCQQDIAVEETSLNIKHEKITPIKRGKRRTSAKCILSKNIMAQIAQDDFNINKNSENEIESLDGLQNHEKAIIKNITTSNSQKADEIPESSPADTLNADGQMENVLEESSLKIKTDIMSPVKKGRRGRLSKSISSNVNVEDSVTNNQNIDETMILSNDNADNASECGPIDTPIADQQVENALEESSLKIKTEKMVLVKRGKRGRPPKSMLPKGNTTTEKNKEDDCEYNKSNTRIDFSKDSLPKDSILINQIVTSAEIHEHVENARVSRDLDTKSKSELLKDDYKMENSSAQNSSEIKSQKLPPVKTVTRGKRPKSSRIDISTKETDVVENDDVKSIIENNIGLQEDDIMQIEEVNENSITEKSIHSDMEIDTVTGDDNVTHDSDLDTIDTDDKIKEHPGKRSSKLRSRSSRHDKRETAYNTSDIPTSSKDNIEKTKQQSRRSSKINVKHYILDSDDEPKNIERYSSNMSVRKSGRRPKSNINYRVPDEDVDIYDSEKQTAKEPSENAPKKRRGRPSKKDALMKLNASTEEEPEKNPRESTQKDEILDATVNAGDSLPVDASNTSTRKRRSTKRSTIDEDIFEVESDPTKQEESMDFPDQSQAETSDAADDFEESHVSDKSDEEDIVQECKPRRGRKRKYSLNTHTTRKRGRPPMKNKVKGNDDDYTPHHSYVPRSTKVKEKFQEITNKKIVKCGKCEKEVQKNQWYSHNLYSHNDMGWLDGTEKPDFENDSKLLMKVLTAAHKKKHKKGLVCETCREVKKSVVGFISHMTFCGKTEAEIELLLVTCDQCGGKFKPSSMEYHERQHRLDIEGKKKRADKLAEKDNDIFEPRSKRKAAEKAVSKISEFTALVKEDDGCSAAKKLKLSSPHIKKFIQKPLATKKISSVLIAKWKRELDNNQDAACTQLGCEFTCKSMEEIREHYATCNYTVTENYVCKVCRFQTLHADEIIKHAAEKHTSEDLDKNAAMSDAETSESEDYSDYDEDGSNKSQGLVKKFFYKETSEIENKMFKFIFNNGTCHTVLNKTFNPGFQWTLEFERKHFKFSIFNNFTPNVFTLLEEKDAESYLPELDSSLPVKFMKKDGHINNSEWRNWSKFDAARIDDCPTFFVGGPVWAMAWAPTPSYLAISNDLPQFLAVSTHPTMDIEYSVGESHSGKNIIQIWNVGKLNNRNASESDPELSYAITHDGGTVWSLEWCPSGCYQHEDFPDLKNESGTNRLGLLAAGCSDGCVRIYSLVFPQDLVRSPDENQYPIYKTEPVMQLIISSDMYENNEQNWQIMKLCWSREANHNVIVAGLSNGYVAFWDLMTKSPMLKYKVNNTTFLRPYRQFFAHHHAVTMVALVSQDNKRYLATASLDKLYKFWDLEDISRPKNTYKKSYVTDGAWFNNWCCAVIVHDNALCTNGNNSAVCLPLRNYTYKYYNILPSNSTIFGVSTSDFGNSVATGNVAGELLTIFPHQLVYIRDMEKTIPPKRSCSLVSTTELVDFETEQDTSNNAPAKRGKKPKSEPYTDPMQFMPSTYKDSKNRFGILFNNKIDPLKSNSKSVQKYKKKPTLTCEQLEQTPIEQYPLKSINKVAWNPNASSFLWLAAGYQNGFVRLISFRSVASTVEWDKLLQSHTNVLKAQMTRTAADDSC